MHFLKAIPSAIAYATALTITAAPIMLAPAAAQEGELDTVDNGVITSGSWTKVSQKASGTWSIEAVDGVRYIVLSDDFRTRGAPDLKIFLTPKAAGSLNGRNAADGATLISELNSPRGGQRYALDADLDLDDYSTIIIHCEQYSKLWAVSSL